jgi:hypothetical protein
MLHPLQSRSLGFGSRPEGRPGLRAGPIARWHVQASARTKSPHGSSVPRSLLAEHRCALRGEGERSRAFRLALAVIFCGLAELRQHAVVTGLEIHGMKNELASGPSQ